VIQSLLSLLVIREDWAVRQVWHYSDAFDTGTILGILAACELGIISSPLR